MSDSDSKLIILNDGADSKAGDTLHIMKELRTMLLRLKGEFMSEDGSSVDYFSMGKSESFQNYKELAAGLRHLDFEPLITNEEERKAFFINLYNIQMIHGLVAQENLPETPTKVQGMWSEFAYNVGGLLFSLDEIEHGVLRCNRGHPKDKKPMFGLTENDPRMKLMLTKFDARIHFALNCGANSCPPIRIYQADRLNAQLDMAAKSFCNQEIQVIDNKVQASKLLLWYKSDFGESDNEVLETICQYITDETLKQNVLHIKNATNNDQDGKIIFKDYNWKLNSK